MDPKQILSPALLTAFGVAVRKNKKVSVSAEAAGIIAQSIGGQLEAVTYLCVSLHVGTTRWEVQGGRYALTQGEIGMFARAQELRTTCQEAGINLRWQIILADGWGLSLYPDRMAAGSAEAYCSFMSKEAQSRGFTTVRWSELMKQNCQTYDGAVEAIRFRARELAPWEATKGQVGKNKPATEDALRIAEGHICMRAAESSVVVADRGATLVLSTEGPGLTKYDNLVVPRYDYTHLYTMPFMAHFLP